MKAQEQQGLMEHHVRDLSTDARQLIEQLLGRPVNDEETISVRSLPVVKEAPPLAERVRIGEELDRYFAGIDRKLASVDPDELEDALDEAMKHVRPSYKPIR